MEIRILLSFYRKKSLIFRGSLSAWGCVRRLGGKPARAEAAGDAAAKKRL
ncbi:MAG TPA: hypothetical protein GXZ40_03970 [Bacteroidales bacterium]|nr:hypothetical protein [Bacteroidales bacterium]